MRKTILTLGLLAAPRAALACPVCFGNSDSPLAIATNMGIFAMLVVVAGMIGACARFFFSPKEIVSEGLETTLSFRAAWGKVPLM